MKYTTSDFQWGPTETPNTLLYLIAITASLSIGATLFNPLFHYFDLTGPESFFGLSWYGIEHFYLWQLFTYFFTQNSGFSGISFSYLLHLCFNLYLLWTFGSSIIERIGITRFFKLYFISGILAGIAGLAMMKLTSHYMVLNGSGAPILALFTFWTLLYSDAEIRLFYLLPVNPRALLLGVVIGIFVIYFSQLDFVSLVVYWTAMITGYLYAVISQRLRSPFSYLKRFEDFVLKSFKNENKIVDIAEGMDDDHFVDAMLSKISKNGENSLSFYERQRLDKISKMKK